MLSTQELRALVKSLDAKAFVAQLGPFALVQRPPAEAMGDPNAGIPQTAMASTAHREQGVLGLIFEFDNLHVATLPPMTGEDTLSVGRLPDCDLIVDEASVSKRHAMLTWHEDTQRCSLKDLGSTNGTFLNASIKLHGEVSLRDGDIISFGDVQFWYLLTETLFAKLKSAGATFSV